MAEEKKKREPKPRVLGMRSSSGVKQRIEPLPNKQATQDGYAAFLEKRGLKSEKWRGLRVSEKKGEAE